MMSETNRAMAAGTVIQKYNISNQQPTKTECMQRVGNEWAKSQIERHVITQSSAKGTPQSNPANYIG